MKTKPKPKKPTAKKVAPVKVAKPVPAKKVAPVKKVVKASELATSKLSPKKAPAKKATRSSGWGRKKPTIKKREKKSIERLEAVTKSLEPIDLPPPHEPTAPNQLTLPLAVVPPMPPGMIGFTKVEPWISKHNIPLPPAPKPAAIVLPQAPAPRPAVRRGDPGQWYKNVPPPPPPRPRVILTPPPAQIELVQDTDAAGRKRYVCKTAPDSRYHVRNRSLIDRPVSVVRRICNDYPNLNRKQVLELCVVTGVDYNTASTQYSIWKTKQAKQ